MKKIGVQQIIDHVAEMCIEANTHLSADMQEGLERARVSEESINGKEIIDTMLSNFLMARKKNIPICQDTGMVVMFVTFGQDLTIEGGSLEAALQAGVAKGYEEGYLRKSVVSDPFIRTNTGNNTPAVIHYQVVPGDGLKIKILPKGFGSENTSALKMLKPSDGIAGVKEFVLQTVETGSPNACAPIVVGVGVGGTMEKAALMAKEALGRPLGEHNQQEHIMALEDYLLEASNALGIGPMGLGGVNTVLGVNVEVFPTHIAGLPVAVNISCYVNRHVEREL
ncbi:MAG: fumarate hydratase subunit alpha [Acetobacterium sp.]|uniref:fumarate hydratase n=1 Tax=unclassified Acetobacterium TaxID=2638182 RepID=UPI000DBEBBF4|nr:MULTISPECIES: fumarate hydratase [unclassified Acetobacterium]AWW28244.1 fumarate hydratase [Acetobacterium sp. KB-1]MDK2940533.1 fumarate hydratase subunit alpha [Acetobacterium sp.]MDZ5724985.1 fumarate hydratase [Acetobacterium sp. K1/6]